MGGHKSKPPPPPPPKPCAASGDEHCKKVANAKGCENKDDDNYYCKCADGYKQKYENDYSECQEINACLEKNGGCDRHATCTNRVALTPICACKGPYWEDAGDTPGKPCKAVDLCGNNHGGCDEHSSCIARKGQQPICKCIEGWTGGTKPGSKCNDINECENKDKPPCGTESQHGICTNTEGSYTCKCEKGYEGTGYEGDCTQIQFCSDAKLNDCDPVFATCALSEGSYKCSCKSTLQGDGTQGFCRVPTGGDPNVYCDILGQRCNEYQDCRPVPGHGGDFECVTKSKTGQLTAFIHDGPSPNTPKWVWGVVSVAIVLFLLIVGYLAYWLYKRMKSKPYDPLAEGAMYSGMGTEYGAVQPAMPEL